MATTPRSIVRFGVAGSKYEIAGDGVGSWELGVGSWELKESVWKATIQNHTLIQQRLQLLLVIELSLLDLLD
ncbi:hypothetical protein C7B77_23955 [Chamaesiphon polymorphus CCALA 037]|uniref:Uncharacterized protein n=1 Tax=Chamaesiphon polymorphus CCALA 037 TaxID=2107692 RepID=A0A2T1FTB8_9CYAN|nr:hypothetical protein C7B77_23955 [Chamaesiphon polymorphus CCALA 037]